MAKQGKKAPAAVKQSVSPAQAIAELSAVSATPALDAEWVVAVCADHSWISKDISWFGAGGWAHMTGYVSPNMVIDARSSWTTVSADGVVPDKTWVKAGDNWRIPPGVQKRPSAYLDSNEFYLEIGLPITSAQYAEAVADLEGQLYKPYDFDGIMGMITGRRDSSWRGDGENSKAWFCDCLQTWVAERRRFIPPLVTPAYRLTPGSALMAFLGAGFRVRRYRGVPVEAAIRAAGINVAALRAA